MANLQKRGGYTPRRARERRAYRLVVAGAGSGLVGIVTLVLAVAGVMSFGIPVILIIVALACLGLFRATVSS